MAQESERAAGLIGEYRDQLGQVVTRVDREMAFHWADGRADVRLAPGPLSVRWRGHLESEASGEYRIFAFGSGRLTVRINGQLVLAGEAAEPQWIDGRPVTLDYDQHLIEIEYHVQHLPRQLAFFWSGPTFAIEPLPRASLRHEIDDDPSDGFARGQTLYRALRCEACHLLEGTEPLAAPALDRLAGHLQRPWLVNWLSRHGDRRDDQDVFDRRMPHLALTVTEASELADYLLGKSKDGVHATTGNDAAAGVRSELRGAPDARDQAQRGREWFLSLGCLACHALESHGARSLLDGGDLSHVAEKRPPAFFAQWLADPSTMNRDHRMPRFELTDKQRSELAVFLSTRLPAERQADAADTSRLTRVPNEPPDGRPPRGRELLRRHRCHACHRAPEDGQRQEPGAPHREAYSKLPLNRQSNWHNSCCGPPRSGVRPGYWLSDADRSALRVYVDRFVPQPQGRPQRLSGQQLVDELRCLGCHERGGEPGIVSQVPTIMDHLAGSRGWAADELVAPSLAAVGDKLHDDALRAAIERSGPSRRPWLKIQMPRFALSEEELDTLVEYFRAVDRIPARDELPQKLRGGRQESADFSRSALRLAGARLVTAEGFGCVSCHRMGTVEPQRTAPGTRGPSLDDVAKIVRRSWFERLLRQPARISRRLEMPSVQTPVRGVLLDDLAAQLDALWHVLDTPGFEPPRPDPVRTVRRSGADASDERAAILTDVVRAGETMVVKPLLVGFANRHSLLYDLQNAAMLRWSVGDVAHQRTEGKSWYWEVAGEPLAQVINPQSEWALMADARLRSPMRRGQFMTELDRWRHIPGGIEFEHRMSFELDDRSAQTLWITQRWVGLQYGDRQGVRRELFVHGLRQGQRLRFHVGWPADRDGSVTLQHGEPTGRVSESAAEAIVHVVEPVTAADTADWIELQPVASDADMLRWQAKLTLHYLSNVAIDRFVEPPVRTVPMQVKELDCIPGFRVTRLPVTDQIMPTALAWTPDGTLVVASLKGRVWRTADEDGDGLEDQLRLLSDELAAPYGLATGDGYVDVLHKSALLRLYDDDGDGRADRTETMASGWGHTDDYHDWAVGLPRDVHGNYFVALPCQQDDRELSAAYLRGHVLRLVPKDPTIQDPRRFRIESWATGQRFPMGLAISREGQLLATDNQGNYNPFNELNHIQKGQDYGFINRLERRVRQRPPHRPPSINIPHPWTRSVNGICFLELPTDSRTGLEPRSEPFGPFTGHLVGCEYDTRRLIRMTLQQVDGQLQGAAYPLSVEAVPAAEGMLGPVCCAVSPAGQLYVGSLRDSGWGAANNVGELLRAEFEAAELPAGIRAVTATAKGFRIEFTRPVDPRLAAESQRYSIASYYRVATADYGGEDQERREVTVRRIDLADDGRSVILEVEPLLAGRVYEIHLQSLVEQGDFFPADAYYTLHRIPPP